MDVSPFEQEVERSPTNILGWLSYLDALSNGPAPPRVGVYERALGVLPGSYKLWMGYLTLAVRGVSGLCLDDPRMEGVNVLFERALVFMHKMPLVWCAYIDFLASQRLITRTRRACDRALQALPVTQHSHLWPRYLEFAKACGCRDTCVRVFRRYLQINPRDRKDFVDYLCASGDWDEAAVQLSAAVNAGGMEGGGGGAHALWLSLCDIVSQHPKDVPSIPVEAVLRSGIGRFSDEVGRMWCALAEHFVRLGEFDRARDVYEEAMASVVTVRDFASVFDAYAQFEEALVTAKLEAMAEGGGRRRAWGAVAVAAVAVAVAVVVAVVAAVGVVVMPLGWCTV